MTVFESLQKSISFNYNGNLGTLQAQKDTMQRMFFDLYIDGILTSAERGYLNARLMLSYIAEIEKECSPTMSAKDGFIEEMNACYKKIKENQK